MILASSWYTSGTFWAAAGVVAVVLVGAVTVLVTYLVGTPRQRLTYQVVSDVELLPPWPKVASDLQVVYKGNPLSHARVMTVRIACSGRRDIPSAAFDQEEPFKLEVGAPIVALLAASAQASGLPKLGVGERALEVGPSLIRKGQAITLALVIDGPKTSVTYSSSLIDVAVRESGAIVPFPKLLVRAALAALSAGFSLLIAGYFWNLLLPIAAGLVLIGGLLTSWMAWKYAPTRARRR